jgi:diguanylate cyclase (GGDEF)-like protein/PAS domain S-box-containing protein
VRIASVFRPHMFALCAVVAVVLSGLLPSLQGFLTDLRFRWTERPASGDIVLVAIDPKSLDQMGVWPWPRSVHAQLIRRLLTVDPGSIAFDVDFSARSDPQSDKEFAEALKAADGAVALAAFQQVSNGVSDPHLNLPLSEFSSNAWLAAVNVRADAGGLVRRYSTDDRLGKIQVPSIAELLSGRQFLKSDTFLIDFGIRPQSIPVVSYVDVLNGKPEALQQVAHKRIIVGGTALELGDRFAVPVYGIVAGPLLQAMAAESLLQRRDLHLSSPAVGIAGVVVLILLMHLTWTRTSPMTRVLLLVGFAVFVEAVAAIVQAKYPVVIDATYIHVAVAAYLVAVALDEIDFQALLRRIAESRFQRFAGTIGDGLVCADANRRINVWNAGATRIFGADAEAMIGKPIDAIWDGNGGFSVASLDQNALRQSGGETREVVGRHKDGELFPIEVCFSGWDAPEGFQLGAVIRDISERKREEARIRYLAEHDTLTGLINRDTLYRHACENAESAATGRLALLIIGINNFHQINDIFGLGSGDEALFEIASRLKSTLVGDGLLARLHGDEFAVLLAGDDAAGKAMKLCAEVAEAFDGKAIEIGGRQFHFGVSTGVAVYPRDCASIEELFGCAHLALGRAKGAKHPFAFFDRGIKEAIQDRMTLEAELARALDCSEFELFYQPQIEIAEQRLIGAEALIRWRHPERGLVSPALFMPVVNASGISDEVGAWVMRTACRQAAAWAQRGHAIRVGVNLSPSMIHSRTLAPLVRRMLAETSLPPNLLELEFTEDILLNDKESALEIFQEVKKLGVRVVFDDFGTGYASLSYLRDFPLDGLKIDRSFVGDLQANSVNAAIVDSTITMAKHLGLSVIAEGIEEPGVAALLTEMGCHEGQGYLFGKPMPVAEFEAKYGLSAHDTVAAA